MEWFSDPRTEDAGEAGQSAVISVLSGGRPVGAGVLLAGGAVLTCAHVVNAALDRDVYEVDHPGTPQLWLAVMQPDGVPRRLAARLDRWIPPRDVRGGRVVRGAVEWHGDLALLVAESTELGSAVGRFWWPMQPKQQVRAWFAAGQPDTFANAVVQECGTRACYLDAEPTGPRIGPGYSGSPLWSAADGAIVGIAAGQLLSADGSPNGYAERALAFSWQTISRELQQAGVDAGRLLPQAGRGAAEPQEPEELEFGARFQLAAKLGELLPRAEDRARYAEYAAQECGLTVGRRITALTAEKLAEAALSRPRLLAALLESLRADRPALADRLSCLPAAVAAPGLLSPAEHRALLTLLNHLDRRGQLAPLLLRGYVVAAAPDIELPPQDGPADYPTLVRQLEGYTGGFSTAEPVVRLVPVLLRVAEFLAAGLADPGSAGRQAVEAAEAAQAVAGWSEQVADRLGVPRAALNEHRAAAVGWARGHRAADGRAASQARVMAYLSRYDNADGRGPGRFTCAVWLDHGWAAPRRAPSATDRPLTPDEVARLLRDLRETLEDERADPADAEPTIEVFLDQADLGLAVESWDGADAGHRERGGLPEPLGMTDALVVRLALQGSRDELHRRTRSQAKRWQHRDAEPVLSLDDRYRSEKQVVSELFQNRKVARVVLRQANPSVRAELAAVCLRYGVPLVCWDREARTAAAAAQVEEVALAGAADGLPERVRSYRAAVYGNPKGYRVRPVLAREDPTRPSLPATEAVDPEELIARLAAPKREDLC
ncbi:hypothetical protein P3T37_006940 [Kitasatospora sp. MAA4]|uniref:VMAP-C domain-containing protein n=1 Tax=Kitasatospora sp. MAA4 TaxID=3035093 RepID=UPI002475DFA6|nr:trypsin-like peptidase domain-containing protein [Kitasatospora sp. MAA4]MDH6137507.1 hypothetical protein [Kitasatospora sp. MAA4]